MGRVSLRSIFAGLLAAALVAAPAGAATLRTLYQFSGATDGSIPAAPVVRDKAGNIYGTTSAGGTYGRGVVYRVTHEGAESVLYSFRGGSDGGTPNMPLSLDSAGNLYGTTSVGGDKTECKCGVVFKVTPEGDYTVLKRFQGGGRGATPQGAPVVDADGKVYGTTLTGGAGQFNAGMVYQISPGGKETNLHDFSKLANNGYQPAYGLTKDAAGNMYGTTMFGGAYGGGVIYKISAADKSFTILHQVGAGPDGATSRGGPSGANLPLVITNGELYGSMQTGGPSTACGSRNGFPVGCGLIYSLTPRGKETILYSFDSPSTTGYGPVGQLARDKVQNLFGISTGNCGGNGCSTVIFKLTPGGTGSTFYSFGLQLGVTGIAIDDKGRLYGATSNGGTHGFGSVFEIDP
ncbi:MAG TPA: choice-of-anchor tandem repeat GloVer-containing protein [Rhizomicrobium sp.]